MADNEAGIGRASIFALAATFIFSASSPGIAEAGGQLSATAQASAAGAGSGRKASDLAYGTTFPARVLRKDRLILGSETRICVATTVDPEARRIVEASGQRFDAEAAQDLTYFTTHRLSTEFRDRGLSRHSPRNRILGYIEHELNPTGCFDRPDTILVRHRVARGRAAQGYAVTLTATQGRRVYEASVERPYAVRVSQDIRHAIDYRSNYVTHARLPYWDPVRDSARMSDMFVSHLLGEAEK